MGEENPGKKPFSEKETLFIKDTVQFFKPKMFLTIHSGMFSMFHPFAYYEGNPTNTGIININILDGVAPLNRPSRLAPPSNKYIYNYLYLTCDT